MIECLLLLLCRLLPWGALGGEGVATSGEG